MFTYKEEPCNSQGHCTCENAVPEAAKCACSAHTHQEPGSYTWRNDELEIQPPCKPGNRKQPDFPSAPCLEVQLSHIHPCICEARLPSPHPVASKPSSLQVSSVFLFPSEKKIWYLYSKKYWTKWCYITELALMPILYVYWIRILLSMFVITGMLVCVNKTYRRK